MSNEELLGQTRKLRDNLRPRAAYFRDLGFDVDAFLAECDRLIAFLEGRSDEWVDVPVFCEKLTAFHNEMRAFAELERQAERVKAIGSIPSMLDAVEGLARRMSNPDDARSAAALQASVEAARKRIERGEVPMEELEDLSLSTQAQKAELSRRSQFRAAALALYWESRPLEWWDRLAAGPRKELEELLVSWRAEREKMLSEMPIADRRRLEALRPEDFDKPGSMDP